MLITFFKTLVSIEQGNNEDVIASCDVCLDGLSSALPSTKKKHPLHVLCSTAAELQILNGKEILLFSLPFIRNVSCPKHHKILFSITPILTAMRRTGCLMSRWVCHLFVAVSEALSCLHVCVIRRRERGLRWPGRSAEHLSSVHVASSRVKIFVLKVLLQSWFSLNNQLIYST